MNASFLTAPGPMARQMTGQNPEGQFILSVLVKRTYRIQAGSCVVAEQQLPLVEMAKHDPERHGLLLADTDLYPWKLMTDVVVAGHAYPGKPVRSFEARIQIGKFGKSIKVTGRRSASISPTGAILFSEPEPMESVLLSFDRAYGGKDEVTESRQGNPFAPLFPYFHPKLDPKVVSPFFYPRNPAGMGYLVEKSREAVESIHLPNLEDPSDILTPERLVCGKFGRWPSMPVPLAFGWVSPAAFPRCAFFGSVPLHDPVSAPIREVVNGHAPADILEPKPIQKKFSFRCTNGAPLGLQVPYLRSGEACRLLCLHPREPSFGFTLPSDCPRIWTDGRNGKLKETKPVIHSVIIEPDESRLSIVWRGATPALRPYLADELAKMPFRVEW